MSPDALKPGDLVPALGVCEVIESRHDVFSAGQNVVLECGLQQLCASDGRHVTGLHPGQTPASTALGILGPPGMAAYFGLLDLGALRAGETVLVSAASNAAGAMAGQIAMLKGARAIGIAGSKEKCDWVLRHARFSACINYRSESLTARLKQLAPHGVDVYFDSSGGELLETIVAGHHVAPGGRVVLNSVRRTDPAELVRRAGYAPGTDALRVLRRTRSALDPRDRLLRCGTPRMQGGHRRGAGERARAPVHGHARRELRPTAGQSLMNPRGPREIERRAGHPTKLC